MVEFLNCENEIKLMLERSKTKVIFPIITYGLLSDFIQANKIVFSDQEIRMSYEKAIGFFKEYLGHDLHIGGRYYDAYPSRNLPKYGVIKVIGNKKYEIIEQYQQNAQKLIVDIPPLVKDYITKKLGEIPLFSDATKRLSISQNDALFKEVIKKHIDINPINFEIFMFSILKVHLEKFACKIYRDTRTSAHDKGVDLSTNFGVIYQIKKLKLTSENSAKDIYDEIQINFSDDRIKDGNVILIIDDITKNVKSFLINMKIQTIEKGELLKLSENFDIEDKMKVLKIVYDEFSREYKSVI
ncbi:MAG: HaeII family restriction endonuclease [Alphaproteobacteria bacterium]|nr:MAG: HaeII family restriction endonuclease [Alphaproteobacteria bacterium]